MLNYGPAAKNSHLTNVLWYEDTIDAMDNLFNLNEDYVKRRFLTAKDKKIDLMGHLHCDVFDQKRFLINGVEMRLRMKRYICICTIKRYILSYGSNRTKFQNSYTRCYTSCQTFKDFTGCYWHTPKLLPKRQQNILSRMLK